jgi:hypothetical protein
MLSVHDVAKHAVPLAGFQNLACISTIRANRQTFHELIHLLILEQESLVPTRLVALFVLI